MKPQILAVCLLLGVLAAPLTASAVDKSPETAYQHTAHRAQIMAYLNRSHELKSEIVSEMKASFAESDLVGLDDTMSSFEVNELVAEIMEAESYQ